jgi:ketosteroid isomerase-like protein
MDIREQLSRLHNEAELSDAELDALRAALRTPVTARGGLEEEARNKELVIRFLRYCHRGEWDAVAGLLADDVTQYAPRPASPVELVVTGRDRLLKELESHCSLYRPGSVTIEMENILAEGPLVDTHYIQRAITFRGDQYANYYCKLFECEDGRIKNFWEYVDTGYAGRLLFDEGAG